MSIFGGGASRVNQPKPETALRVNTAVYGLVRPFGAGQRRLPWNLIWVGDFKSQAHSQGGKGGPLTGGKGGGKGGGTTYTYSAAVAGGVCEGPVSAIGPTCWDTDGTQFQLSSKNLTAFTGSYSQSAWSYLTSKHPADADTFRGLGYMAAGPMQLGSSNLFPNITVETTFAIHGAASGWIDAHPKDHFLDYLTNPYYGLGFPESRLDTSLTQWFNYCKAASIFISPAYLTAQTASQHMQDMMEITNSELVWDGAKLTVVPYGDQSITGNGVTYSPPTQPLYSIGDDDILPNQGASSSSISSAETSDPVVITIKPNSQSKNIIKVQFNERVNNYNPQVVDAKDDADIAMNGEKPADLKTYDAICVRSVASTVAHNLLGRETFLNEPFFTVGPKYKLLTPMSIVEVNAPKLGMINQWVRIKEITRNGDKSFSLQCEEYQNGAGHTPVFGSEAGAGYNPNSNVDPGDASAPILINPPSMLTAGALEAWIAVAGTDPNWGGCEVHISFDGSSYSKVGQINGAARYGELETALASGSDPDTVNSFEVDLSASLGQLTGGSQADVDAFATLAIVDDELIAYRDVSLLSTYEFDVSYLRRGAYGTAIASHSIGASFVRLDERIFKLAYTSAQKGTTIYVKLPSFNIYGGGLQDVSTVTACSIVLSSDGKFYYPQPTASGTILLDQSTAGSVDFPCPDPASVPFLIIEITGGGGPGGGTTSGTKGATLGYGAGSGAFVRHKIANPGSSTTLSFIIGNGGQLGVAGEDTTLDSEGLTAGGGQPGTNAVNGTGGVASGGSEDNIDGTDGGATNTWDGGGAPNGGGDQTTAGMPGTAPGGGGSGTTTTAGSTGAPGRVKITASST